MSGQFLKLCFSGLILVAALGGAPLRTDAQTTSSNGGEDESTLSLVGGGVLGALAGVAPGLLITGRADHDDSAGSIAPALLTVAAGAAAGAVMASRSDKRLLWSTIGAGIGYTGGLFAGFIFGRDKSGMPEALFGLTVGAVIGAVVTKDEPAPVPAPAARRLPITIRLQF